MKAKSIIGSSIEEISAALKQSMTDGFTPTLAIVFISIKQDRKAICEILHEKGIDIFGATSCGEFINGHQSKGEIVVMLLDINKNDYCVLFEDIGNRTLDDAATNMTNAALQKFKKPAIILCSTFLSATGKMIDGETLVRSIEKVAGPQVNLFGGMAGDDITMTGTYVFTHNESTDYGMVALIFNEDKISFQGMAISGWKPIGITRIATKTDGNLIYTIDDKPAIEMYLRFLGKEMNSTDDMLDFYHSVGVHYPFQILREGREPMMCNPFGYDKDKNALMCESDVEQGSSFRFSTPPDFDIVETIVDAAKNLKEKTNAEADALLIFSCAGRLSALGPMAQQENDGLTDVWKVPMAGFYTYGEYGRAINGKHEFHSTTNSWVALKEK